MKNIFNSDQDFQEIVSRISGLKAEQTRKWGSMNVSEMMVHLTDQLRLALGEKTSTPEGPFIFRTWLGQKAALYLVPWRKGKETSPTAMNKDIGGSNSQGFEKDQSTLIEKLKEVKSKAVSELKPHPLFGKFSGNDWGRMIYKHADHHLRQFGA